MAKLIYQLAFPFAHLSSLLDSLFEFVMFCLLFINYLMCPDQVTYEKEFQRPPTAHASSSAPRVEDCPEAYVVVNEATRQQTRIQLCVQLKRRRT